MKSSVQSVGSLLRWALKVLALLAGTSLLVIIGTLFLPRRISLVIEELIIGWWKFANRSLPLLTINWDLLGMAAVCVLGVLALSHWLLRRFARWHLRSSIALNGLLWLSFLTATAVAGTVEQMRWLYAIENEPLVAASKWGTRASQISKYLSTDFQRRVEGGMSLESAASEVRLTHQPEFSQPKGNFRDFRAFYLANATNGYAGLIVFRRQEVVHPDHHVAFCDPESGSSEQPREHLPQLLSQTGLRAVPLF